MVGADPELMNTLRSIGQDIGEAFQLRDDQLGVFGDPSVTGKPSGDDLRTGKRTALINLALQAENRGEGAGVGVEKLRDGLGTASTEEEVDALREVIEATGAAETVERWITQRSQRAIETITSAQLGAQITDELVEMTVALSDRKF